MQYKPTKIMVLREAITKVTQILAGQRISVVQRGVSANVQYDAATGLPKAVHLPMLPDNASDELCDAIQGFLDHEVGHVLHTDSKVLFEAKKAGKSIQGLHNIVEDVFVEKKQTQMFKGSGSNLATVGRFYLKQFVEPQLKEARAAGDAETELSVLLPSIIRALGGQFVFEEFVNANGGPMAADLMAKLTSVAPKLQNMASSADALALTHEIAKLLQQDQPPQSGEGDDKQQDQPNQGGKDGQEDDNQEDGQSGQGDQQQPQDQEKDDQGQGQPDEGQPEEGDGEAEPGAGQEGDGQEDESDGEKGSGGSGESQERDKEQKESKGKGKKPEPQPEPEPEEESQPEDEEGAGDQGAGDAEPEGDSDPSDGQADGDADQSESPSDSSGEDDTNPDDSQQGDGETDDTDTDQDQDQDQGQDQEGDGGDSGDGGEQDGDIQDMENSLDPGEVADNSNGNETTQPAGLSWEEIAAAAEGATDYDQAAAEAMGEMAIEAAKDADYLVYTTDEDKIEPLEVPHHRRDWAIEQCNRHIEAPVLSMVNPMQKELERAIAARSAAVHIGGQRSGRLHGPGLVRLKFNDDRVFRRKEENHTKDVVVELVIDISGSMGGTKVLTATRAAFALSSVLERLRIKHEIVCFTTGHVIVPHGEMLDAQRRGVKFARTENIVMPIIKDFNESLNSTVRARLGLMPNDMPMSCNIDGESVEYAARRLMKQRAARHVMIVLSDGEPAGHSMHPDRGVLLHDLKRRVQRLEACGIDIVGIGIESTAVQHFYSKCVVLNNVNELPTTVIKQLRGLLIPR